MKHLLAMATLLGIAGGVQAQGLVVAAAETGAVVVYDKSWLMQPILTFRPYGGGTGLYVAAGDVNGDGRDDVITGPPPGLGERVRVFDQAGGLHLSLEPYPGFLGGVRVAAGDVTGDGIPDIITGAGPGAPGGHVKVIDGRTGAELRSFFAYDTGFIGGVYVAAGDINGDGFDDIITGADAGAGPHVKVFSGQTGAELASFFAYDPSFSGGVRVAAGDVNGDGRDDIITGAGPGAGPHVKVFDGRSGATVQSFFAFDPGFQGGVYVGSGSVIATPGASTGAIATIRIFQPTGEVQWLMPYPGYTGSLTIGTSPGVWGKAPARPRIPGAK